MERILEAHGPSVTAAKRCACVFHYAPAPMRTAADRTLELLEAQVGRPLSEVETPVAVVDLDRLEVNLARAADVRRRARHRALAAHEDAQVAGDRPAAARARRRRADGREDGGGAGLPGGRRAAHPRALPALRRRQVGRASRALAAEGIELTVAVDGIAPAEGLAAALQRRGATAELLVEMDVGLHRTGPDDRRRRARAGAGALAPAGRRGGGHQLLPGHCRGDDELVHARVAARRRAAARGARRVRGRRACAATASRAARRRRATSRTRPASTSCAPAPTRCSTATTATARPLRAVGRGDGRSRTPCPGRS